MDYYSTGDDEKQKINCTQTEQEKGKEIYFSFSLIIFSQIYKFTYFCQQIISIPDKIQDPTVTSINTCEE